MANKQAPKKAKTLKPEYSIRVVPKKTPVKKTASAKQPKKVAKKTPSWWQRQPRERKFLIILAAVSLCIASVTTVYVAISLKQTNDALDRAAKAADDLNTIDPEITRKTRLIGSNEQLTKEIDGYASAPADLQSYVLKDYRALKQNCIVNSQVYGSLSFAISSVADAEYAQIKRNCNGEQTLILKKFGEKWTVVHEGNDPPLCSLVNDLTIPQRVALNCVTGGTTYLNPNP